MCTVAGFVRGDGWVLMAALVTHQRLMMVRDGIAV